MNKEALVSNEVEMAIVLEGDQADRIRKAVDNIFAIIAPEPSCRKCRFYFNSMADSARCRRHAPVIDPSKEHQYDHDIFPPALGWCGDFMAEDQ